MRDGFPQFLALIALFAPSSAKATNMAGAPLVHCRMITGENFLTGDVNGKMVRAEITFPVEAGAVHRARDRVDGSGAADRRAARGDRDGARRGRRRG